MDLFDHHELDCYFRLRFNEPSVATAPRTSLTYEEVVRELMAAERQYLRELHMIIKVFR